MSFNEWLKGGQLRRHEPAPDETARLLALAGRRLADGRAAGLSDEGRFLFLYEAALTLATVALRAEGYRSGANVPGHHKITLASLELTLGLDASAVNRLDKYRKKRNRATYEASATVTAQEISELAALVQRLKADLERWLRKRHPGLMP